MNPTVFAMRHPITTLTLVVALISGGALAYTKMRVDIFPSLNVPEIYVFLDYVGMSPGQMAGFIVIQDELGSDSGVAVAALNPDRADAGSIESHVGLKPVAARRPAPTLTRWSERLPSLVRSRPSKSASVGIGQFATTLARSPRGSGSKDD